MKKRLYIKIAACALIFTGLFILTFPAINNEIYTQKIKIEMEQYIKKYTSRGASSDSADYPVQIQDNNHSDIYENDKLPQNFLEDLYLNMVKYNEKLYENGQEKLSDPFSYQYTDIDMTDFGFDENIIGYLSIPRINIVIPVYLGASNENMKKGAAHLTYTSLPVGGINTNAVISAHRGFSTAKMFRQVHELEYGDQVIMTNFRETLIYSVSEIKIIEPTDIEEILIQPGCDLLTLLTCNPIGHNYQRYIVYCRRNL